MFIVVCDHPFYPEVEQCGTLEKAQEIAKKFEDDMFAEDGTFECIITISEVTSKKEFKSNY